MSTLRTSVSWAFVVLGGLVACSKEPSGKNAEAPGDTVSVEDTRLGILEGYPADLVKVLDVRDSALAAPAQLPPDSAVGLAFQSMVASTQRWRQQQRIKVAFLGGSPDLRDSILKATQAWQKLINLKLDFGFDPQRRTFREWTRVDKAYGAHIRISFDRKGYWSLVGQVAIDPRYGPPDSSSMNFDDFDAALPVEWEGTVLHEFGHALGLLHEHQNPAGNCENEFRWEDDPGYVRTVNAQGWVIPDRAG